MLKPNHTILRGRGNMRRSIPLFVIFILLSASGLYTSVLYTSTAFAQNTGSIPRSSDNKSGKLHKDDDQEVTLPEDMRIKMAIAREENEDKKRPEDVEKLRTLPTKIRQPTSDLKHT